MLDDATFAALKQSADQLNAVLQAEPCNADLLNGIGEVALELDHVSRAREYFLAALQVQHAHLPALRNLVRVERRDKKETRLLPLLCALVRENPGHNGLLELIQEVVPKVSTGDPELDIIAFSDKPDVRLQGHIQHARKLLENGDVRKGILRLERATLVAGHSVGDITQALIDLYQKLQDIPSIQSVLKRAAGTALMQGDFDSFLTLAYRSIYAEQMYSANPQYHFSATDSDLNTYAALAAELLDSKGIATRPLKQARRSHGKVRIGFVLEGLSQIQAPSRMYLSIMEAYDFENVDAFFYVRQSSGEPVAVRNQYDVSASQLNAHGCTVRFASEPLSPLAQVCWLNRQIQADEIDVLVYQTVYFVPVYNVLSHLRPAPVQVLVEHQQPEHASTMDLVFTTRKAAMESSARTAPFPVVYDKEPSGTAHARASFGIPEGATLLVSANRATRYDSDAFWREATALLERHSNVWFVAIGMASAPEKVQQNPAIASRIVTPGFRSDVMSFLKMADVYLDIFPSGGGTSLIEAMFAGLPVVTFDQNYDTLYTTSEESLPEYVGDRRMIVPHNAFERWHALLDQLIDDASFRQEVGAEARVRAQQYLPEAVASRFFGMLLSMVASEHQSQ